MQPPPQTSASAVVVSASVAVVTPPPAPDYNARLETLAVEFLDGYLELQPVRATEYGDHTYDARWPDLSEAGEAGFKAFLQGTREKLAAIPVDSLSIQNKVDAAILLNQLDLMSFVMDELKPAETDPVFYTTVIGDGLDPLVSREFAKPDVRAKSLVARLDAVPSVVDAAKKRLKNPPKIYTETASKRNKGLIELCEVGFKDIGAQVPMEKANIDAAAKKAVAALKDYQKFLDEDLLPRSTGEFRVGKERFQKHLRLVLDDDVDANAQMLEAMSFVRQTQKEMVDTSRELWPQLFPTTPWKEPADEKESKALIKKTLTKLSDDRPSNKTVVGDAEKSLASATAFVKEKNLVRVPDEPVKILLMPEYRRGIAIAYCDASGPLETKPQTFYAIAPTPKDWKTPQVDSYYREYNRAMLQELTLHEAMPGHYLQLMHNNRFPSKLRAVFSHGAFVEGWAVYGEWLMAKYGYGGPKVKMQRLKMALRMAANAVLDFGVHASDMSEKQAMSLMMDDAFQEEAEAAGKWRRVSLTSAQLTTYYYGFTQMMKLRAANEGKPGFSERDYHDKLLRFGSPPPRHLSSLLDAP